MKKNNKNGRGFTIVNPNAAGIDIGSRVHCVAVPDDRASRAVESFGCVTAELERMASWLKGGGIETVAMEATGVYWIPVCAVLEDHGFEVILVDPRQVKNAKGRKTDVQDSAWIQKLHSFGLLSASFRPDRELQPIRDYWRMRTHLVRDAARQIHLMQKSLEQMNVQLHKVLSDISGVSGIRILRAIVSGVRNPEELAAMAVGGIKATPKKVAESLRGHYREQHVFALSQALKTFDFVHERIRECDREIERIMKRIPSKKDENRTLPRQKRRKNQPHFDLAQELVRVTGVDFSIVPGLSAMTTQAVVSECSANPPFASPANTDLRRGSDYHRTTRSRAVGSSQRNRSAGPRSLPWHYGSPPSPFGPRNQRLVIASAGFALDWAHRRPSPPWPTSWPSWSIAGSPEDRPISKQAHSARKPEPKQNAAGPSP